MAYSLRTSRTNPGPGPGTRVRCRTNPNPSGTPQNLPTPDNLYRVVIIDNDHNTYEEVILVCMHALGVDYEHALRIALAVDNNGEAEVFQAAREEAERVANLIRTIGIEVRVLPVRDA